MIKTSVNDEIINYCIKNYELGNFKYFTDLVIHEYDILTYEDWLFSCELCSLKYCLCFIETDRVYKHLCGFSSFPIIKLFDSVPVDLFKNIDNYFDVALDIFTECAHKSKYIILSKINHSDNSILNKLLDEKKNGEPKFFDVCNIPNSEELRWIETSLAYREYKNRLHRRT